MLLACFFSFSFLTFLLVVICLLLLNDNTGAVARRVAIDGDNKLGVAGQGQHTIVIEPLLTDGVLHGSHGHESIECAYE